MNKWTVIWYDGNDNQYSYVEADEPDEISNRQIIDKVNYKEYRCDPHVDIICVIPEHVAVNFP